MTPVQMPDPNIPAATLWLLLAVVALVFAAGWLLRHYANEGLTKAQIRERNEAWDREIGPW